MKIALRQWLLSDAKDLSRALSNVNILNNLRDGLPFPYTVSDAEDYINFIINSPNDSVYCYAITADNTPIGSIGIFRKDNIHCRTGELGYYISEPYWGKGIATYSVKQACKKVFDTTDIIRIFAEPFSTNTASCKVLAKAGFLLEGVMRSNAVKNNLVLDMDLYALIKQ